MNKSDVVRKLIAANPTATCKTIKEMAKAEGCEISTPLFYKIKRNGKAPAKAVKAVARRGRKAKAVAAKCAPYPCAPCVAPCPAPIASDADRIMEFCMQNGISLPKLHDTVQALVGVAKKLVDWTVA